MRGDNHQAFLYNLLIFNTGTGICPPSPLSNCKYTKFRTAKRKIIVLLYEISSLVNYLPAETTPKKIEGGYYVFYLTWYIVLLISILLLQFYFTYYPHVFLPPRRTIILTLICMSTVPVIILSTKTPYLLQNLLDDVKQLVHLRIRFVNTGLRFT